MTLPPDAAGFRRALGRFPTGVAVVTTVRDGQPYALTASSFTSVSLEPLLVLFCPAKAARLHDAVLETGTFGVSVLAEDQVELSRRFAERARALDDQLAGVACAPGPVTGNPLLAGAAAVLECRTSSTTDAGDHTVVVGEVLGLGAPGRDVAPLVYYEGRYRALAPLPPS